MHGTYCIAAEMNLLELRKYAIDHRVEIRFGNPQTSRECLINNKGQVRIPGENKDFRIEEAFDATEKFVIVCKGAPQHLTREAMAKAIAEGIGKGRRSGPSDEEEE